MNIFKKLFLSLIFALFCIIPKPAKADLWGADLPLLAEIVFNTLQQLLTMKEMLENGQEQLDLMKEINAGINDSLHMMETSFPNVDPGTFKNWSSSTVAIRELEKIYGKIIKSGNSEVESATDSSVAEAIALNNDLYKYTRDIDKIAEKIKVFSHDTSPGGAAKLTAQGVGVSLNLMSEQLRTQATSLKLQAQKLALDNKQDKEKSRETMDTARALSEGLRNSKPTFSLPSFPGLFSSGGAK
jgi:hypothetical protein